MLEGNDLCSEICQRLQNLKEKDGVKGLEFLKEEEDKRRFLEKLHVFESFNELSNKLDLNRTRITMVIVDGFVGLIQNISSKLKLIEATEAPKETLSLKLKVHFILVLSNREYVTLCNNFKLHPLFLQNLVSRQTKSVHIDSSNLKTFNPENETDAIRLWINPMFEKISEIFGNLNLLEKEKSMQVNSEEDEEIYCHDFSLEFKTKQTAEDSPKESKLELCWPALLPKGNKSVTDQTGSETNHPNSSNEKKLEKHEKHSDEQKSKNHSLQTFILAIKYCSIHSGMTESVQGKSLALEKSNNLTQTSGFEEKATVTWNNARSHENGWQKQNESLLKMISRPFFNGFHYISSQQSSFPLFVRINDERKSFQKWSSKFAKQAIAFSSQTLAKFGFISTDYEKCSGAAEEDPANNRNLSVKTQIDLCMESFWKDNFKIFRDKKVSFRTKANTFLYKFEKATMRVAKYCEKYCRMDNFFIDKRAEVLANFGFIAKANIAQFENWAKFLLFTSHKALLITCFLLNDENKIYMKLFHKDLRRTIFIKRGILEKLFHKNLKEESHSEERILFLLKCTEEMNSTELVLKLQEIYQSYKTSDENPEERDLEYDAIMRSQARDPPGQRSVYIPPGDTNREAYRLSTFLKFPTDTPVSPRRLAAIGFIYMGYKDWVKCFSCGSIVTTWTVGDDEKSARWHHKDCSMITGRDHENIPIGQDLFGRFRSGRVRNNLNQESNQTDLHNSEPNPLHPTTPPKAPVTTLRQTARHVERPVSPMRSIELATIPSVQHENFIRSLRLESERDRLKTFSPWPANLQTVIPSNLARWGFFYLGNSDRVQCFSCGGVLRNWNYGDNVEREHRRHFANCRFLSGDDNRNIPLPESERPVIPPINRIQPPPDPSPSEQRNLEIMFPCLYPASAHMRSEEQRFETFDDRWKTNVIHATPREIAQAGFFFLGDRDRVKCWYCNGGLQNWDPEDEPWTEHAKWFPTCEYLLRSKGPDFAHRIVALYPNLPRPRLQGAFDVPPGGYTQPRRPPSPPPPIIDPKIETQRVQTSVNQAMNSEIAQNAKEMGYEERTIRQVLKRRFESENSMYDSTTAFIEDLLAFDEELQSEYEEEKEPETSQATSSGQENQTNALLQSGFSMPEGTTPSMEARVRELIDERKCKICLDKLADIVFIPCGHLCCCASCAPALRKCPICRVKIAKAIKTYVS